MALKETLNQYMKVREQLIRARKEAMDTVSDIDKLLGEGDRIIQPVPSKPRPRPQSNGHSKPKAAPKAAAAGLQISDAIGIFLREHPDSSVADIHQGLRKIMTKAPARTTLYTSLSTKKKKGEVVSKGPAGAGRYSLA